jgi:hypothetical protein
MMRYMQFNIKQRLLVCSFKVPISLVGPLRICKERKKLVNKFKSFFDLVQ